MPTLPTLLTTAASARRAYRKAEADLTRSYEDHDFFYLWEGKRERWIEARRIAREAYEAAVDALLDAVPVEEPEIVAPKVGGILGQALDFAANCHQRVA